MLARPLSFMTWQATGMAPQIVGIPEFVERKRTWAAHRLLSPSAQAALVAVFHRGILTSVFQSTIESVRHMSYIGGVMAIDYVQLLRDLVEERESWARKR